MNKHLKQLLQSANKEYDKISDSINDLLHGTGTAEDVNNTVDSALERIDNLIDEYESNHYNCGLTGGRTHF